MFYPAPIKPKDYLGFYAKYFDTAEINNSFYKLPGENTFREWGNKTPPGFVFSVKASRYITHVKKLKEPPDPVSVFLEKADALAEKLGPILFQLPPHWRCNTERLKDFLSILPDKYLYAFELRDPSWFNKEVYDLLALKNSAFCVFELGKLHSPKIVTADFVYLRLHGHLGPYKGLYPVRAIRNLAAEIRAWAMEGRDVYCYFDNDEKGYAVKNAMDLKKRAEV